MESYIPPFYSPSGKNIQVALATPLVVGGELNGGYAWNRILHRFILPQEKHTSFASNHTFTWGRIKRLICMELYIPQFYSPSGKTKKSCKQPYFSLGENYAVDMHGIVDSAVLFSLGKNKQIMQATPGLCNNGLAEEWSGKLAPTLIKM